MWFLNTIALVPLISASEQTGVYALGLWENRLASTALGSVFKSMSLL